MGFGTLALAMLTLVVAPKSLLPPGNLQSLVVLILLGIGPTLGGYGLFTLSLAYASARIASLIVVLEVPIATLLAVVALHERLEWLQIVGMVLILLAAVLPSLAMELRQRAEPAQQPARVIPSDAR